jgi:vacuolar-type H+-ATPase subunit I/STV1
MKQKKSGRKFTKSRKDLTRTIDQLRAYRELVMQEYSMMENSLSFMTNDKAAIQQILLEATNDKTVLEEIPKFKAEVSRLFEVKFGRKPAMNYIEIQLGSIVNRIDSNFIEILFNNDLKKSQIQEVLGITDEDNQKPFHKWTKFKFETFDIDKYLENIIERSKTLYKVELDLADIKTKMADQTHKLDMIRKIYDEEKDNIAKTEDLNTLTGFLV